MAKAKDEITVSRSALLSALDIVKAAVASRGSKQPNPLLSDFCFLGTTVHAHNGIIAIQAPLDSGVVGAVQADVLQGMLVNANCKDVSFAVDDGVLLLKMVRSRIKLPLRDRRAIDESFVFPDLAKISKVEITDRPALARALDVVLKSAVPEVGQAAEISNLMLAPDGESTWLYATDRKTFSQWVLPLEIARWPKVKQTVAGVVLHTTFCTQLVGLLKDKKIKKITLQFTDKLAAVTADEVVLVGRAIYPEDPFDFQVKIVDNQYKGATSTPWPITPAFRHAVSRACIVLKGNAKIAGTTIAAKGRELRLTTIGDAGRIDDAVSTGDADQSGTIYIDPLLIERCFDVAENLEMTLLPDAVAFKEASGYLYIVSTLGPPPGSAGEADATDGGDPAGDPGPAGDPVTDEPPRRRRTKAA